MKKVKKKLGLDNLKTHHFPRILAVVLLSFLTVGILFYWQNAITLESLVFWVFGLVVIGLVFILGIRVAQRDAFLDGFRNGRKKR